MTKKINTGHIMQINAIAMDTLGMKVPQILDMLGVKVEDEQYLEKLIEAYGNNFYVWLSEYMAKALPSYEGNIPDYIMNNEEVRNFIYDLLMNFYIARMLIIELVSPYSDVDPENQE